MASKKMKKLVHPRQFLLFKILQCFNCPPALKKWPKIMVTWDMFLKSNACVRPVQVIGFCGQNGHCHGLQETTHYFSACGERAGIWSYQGQFSDWLLLEKISKYVVMGSILHRRICQQWIRWGIPGREGRNLFTISKYLQSFVVTPKIFIFLFCACRFSDLPFVFWSLFFSFPSGQKASLWKHSLSLHILLRYTVYNSHLSVRVLFYQYGGRP